MSLEYAIEVFDWQIDRASKWAKKYNENAKELYLLSQELTPADYKELRNIQPGEYGTSTFEDIQEHLVFLNNPKPEHQYYELKIKIIKNYLLQKHGK